MAITIHSLRGGMNDTDPPIALSDDQTTLAQNVEYVVSTLGERRRGGVAIERPASWPFGAATECVWLHRHLPTTNPADAQLWAICIAGSTAILAYKDTTWHTVAMPDAMTIDGSSEYQVEGITLHGKLFIAYNSAVDRLHCFDPRTSTTSLRRVGMEAVVTAPTAVDTAVAGSFTLPRYYRVRETVQVSGATILRSEPSAVLTFTPNGSFDGAIVTKPTTVNSDPAATHWELEASIDNRNFYVLATTAIGTAAVTDTASSTGYAIDFDLSIWNIGDYIPPRSAKHLIADEDRLIPLGNCEDSDLASSMSWTPVHNATGVGNDERITLDPVSVINLDGFEGGAITDVSRPVAGEIWIFKQEHTYKVTRTGIRTRAYDSGGGAVSKDVGAIPGSVVSGTDEAGHSALYFFDPGFGPYRVTNGGLQRCGRDVWNTFQGINLDASRVVVRSLFYPTTAQVFWNIATDGDVPDLGLTLHTNEQRGVEGGEARRGWVTRTGASTGALAMCLFADNIDADTTRSQTLVPFIGVVGGGLIWRLDTGNDDNGTEYSARQTTKPFAIGDLQTEVEIKSATLVAKAQDGASLIVSAIPNYDEDSAKPAGTLDFTPVNGETQVTRRMDDLSVSECTTVQIDFADESTPGNRWELGRFAMTVSSGQGN